MHIPWRAVLLFTGGYGLFLFFAIYFIALSFFILIIRAGVSWLTVKDCLFLSTSGDISFFTMGLHYFYMLLYAILTMNAAFLTSMS